MASFSSLNDDVIRLVLLNFVSEEPSFRDTSQLCKVALVNRRLNAMASPYIFRHCILRINLSGPPERSTELLIRSLNEQPRLTLNIQTLNIYFCKQSSHKSHICTEKACSIANKILAKAPNVWRFRILGCLKTKDKAFDFSLLRMNCPVTLQELSISSFKVTLNEVIELMNLKPLRLLRIGKAKIEPFIGYNIGTYHQTSAISTLDLLASPMFEEDLKMILQMTPKLRVLTANISVSSTSEAQLTQTSSASNVQRYLLAPKRVLSILQPLHATLMDLRLDFSNNRGQWSDIHDGTRLDLHEFRTLQRLEAHSGLFFHTESPDETRVGFHKLLPCTIEDVNVSYRVC